MARIGSYALSAPKVVVPVPEELQPPPGPRGGQGNRKTRNAQIRSRILTVPQAAPVKAADRICHLEYGDNPGLRKMYMREWPDFQYILPLIPLDMQERLIGAHDGV